MNNMNPNTTSSLENTVVSSCCIRCAQLYKDYPDLTCNPLYQDDRHGKGLTRREAAGCKNCRTRKLKCYPVPSARHPELHNLQQAARQIVELRERGTSTVAAFYQLRSAQLAFSKDCSMDRRTQPQTTADDDGDETQTTEESI